MIFLVSDLHMGDGGPEDHFTTSGGVKAFSDFLDMVGDQPLIGNGDILELWAYDWQQIVTGKNWPIVSRLMNHPNFTYILGNHDLNQKAWPKTRLSLQIDAWTILHGHQFDPSLNSGWKQWLAEESDELIQKINNPELNEVRDWFSVGDRNNAPLIAAVENTGKNWIMGHSHQPDSLMLKGGGMFVNSGCWIDGDPHYVTINNGMVQLHKWQG